MSRNIDPKHVFIPSGSGGGMISEQPLPAAPGVMSDLKAMLRESGIGDTIAAFRGLVTRFVVGLFLAFLASLLEARTGSAHWLGMVALWATYETFTEHRFLSGGSAKTVRLFRGGEPDAPRKGLRSRHIVLVASPFAVALGVLVGLLNIDRAALASDPMSFDTLLSSGVFLSSWIAVGFLMVARAVVSFAAGIAAVALAAAYGFWRFFFA